MFVILEHSVPAAAGATTHWDFLIEIAGQERLATWRLAHDPLHAAGDIATERLADHRRVYLDFEGELTGNRGYVRIIEQGPATIEKRRGDELVAHLEGTRLRGCYEIAADREGGLVFRSSGKPDVRAPS